METSPCSNSVTGHQIATNFCTCHDSTAVVPCTKFCSDHCIGIEMRAKRNFYRIWIAMEKTLVIRGPEWTNRTAHPLGMLYSMFIMYRSLSPLDGVIFSSELILDSLNVQITATILMKLVMFDTYQVCIIEPDGLVLSTRASSATLLCMSPNCASRSFQLPTG